MCRGQMDSGAATAPRPAHGNHAGVHDSREWQRSQFAASPGYVGIPQFECFQQRHRCVPRHPGLQLFNLSGIRSGLVPACNMSMAVR